MLVFLSPFILLLVYSTPPPRSGGCSSYSLHSRRATRLQTLSGCPRSSAAPPNGEPTVRSFCRHARDCRALFAV
ncbi:hypothetical protein PR002_g1400 [Phytophthora rubi]|uniref:RxLR effector protein n=1 Tax=Phytophthora rubi TaxID=129364 RepID=A0A6A3NW37_9STRA|nr:hypothetical protein PR002_g1400 [Phytophthora rubi]